MQNKVINHKTKNYNVLIVYHYIALYREAIFCRLIEDNEMNFFIASDLISNNDIKLISLDSPVFDSGKYKYLKNAWISNKFLWQKGLISLVMSGDFDRIILLGDPHFITTWIVLVLARFKGIRSYLWTHGFLKQSKVILGSIKMLMYRLAHGILLYGNEAKNDLIEAGISSEKLFVIYNSLDYENQKEIRNNLSLVDLTDLKRKLFKNYNLLQLIFVGRLTNHKKIDLLLNSVISLNEFKPQVNLLLVGDGEAKPFLEEMSTRYGMRDNICFYGACYSEAELAPLICSSDVCVSPGEVGLTAMHSLAYGIPVITHNNRFRQMPEYEAIIDGETGFLFEYNCLSSLIEKISFFMNNSNVCMKENCINIIEKQYNPNTQANLIKNAI